MVSPKVSIIVPVYNVEKYLSQCLDSLINQTIEDIEIICVNDGSTDNSPSILDNYSEKDSRIRVINKKNGGLSSARNAGIEVAKGVFIGFVDSDDFVDLEMYEKLYNEAKLTRSDICMCSVRTIDVGTSLPIDDSYYDLSSFKEAINTQSFKAAELDYWLFSLPVVAVNKIYKSSLLKENNIKFIEGICFEDMPFYFSTILSAQKISLVKEHYYNYRINRKGSIINSVGNSFLDIFWVYKDIEKTFENHHLKRKFGRLLGEQHISGPIHRFLSLDKTSRDKYFHDLKKYITSRKYTDTDLREMYWQSANYYKAICLSGGPKSFLVYCKVLEWIHDWTVGVAN